MSGRLLGIIGFFFMSLVRSRRSPLEEMSEQGFRLSMERLPWIELLIGRPWCERAARTARGGLEYRGGVGPAEEEPGKWLGKDDEGSHHCVAIRESQVYP